MITTFHLYADPGHAWLKVPIRELDRLGIRPRISAYSYWRGAHAYLEEDCDLAAFMEARRWRGEPIKMIRHHTDRESRIRRYLSICACTVALFTGEGRASRCSRES